MSSPTPPQRIFIRHAQAASLPEAEDPAENDHLTQKGIAQAIAVGRGEIGTLARTPGTRIFCSTYDRATETLICILDPDGGPAAIAQLRAAVKGRKAKKAVFAEERFHNLQVPLPPILEGVTFDRKLYKKVPPDVLALQENMLIVGHYDAGCDLFKGRELRNAEGLPF